MARLNIEPLEGRDLMSAGFEIATPGVVGLTAPLGSTKGSVVAGTAGDGLGTAEREGQTQGIIAILIGFNAPTRLAAAAGS
jgi:hypothetical protein